MDRNVISISGASGLIGAQLSQYLEEQGHRVIRLDRSYFEETTSHRLDEAIAQSDVVINLAGESIDCRWNHRNKKRITDSRIKTTQMIVTALNKGGRASLLISASAVGIYPLDGCYDEECSESASGFLSELCFFWEQEARKATSVRVVIARIAPVMTPIGGIFPKLIAPLRYRISMVIGQGKQSFPWIDLEDLIRAMDFVREHKDIEGVVNFVAPIQSSQRDIAEMLGYTFKGLMLMKIPFFVVRWLLGKRSLLLIKGQCVFPHKLEGAGYVFRSPDFNTFMNSNRYLWLR